jgi:putrescine transport system ATP-binding protein
MIHIEALSKRYGQEQILDRLDLQLAQGRCLSLLGPSGGGKSTLLKILAGWEQADAGKVYWQGQSVLELPIAKRGLVYLSQEPLLFPHLKVWENLAYGLRLRGQGKAEIQQRVEELANQLGLSQQLDKNPEQLSGGQKQRLSFGRALIIQPKVLLLDEPFASLDAPTRAEMQALFARLRELWGFTAIFVTHDLKEALLLGDEVGYLQKGKLLHYPSPAAFAQSSLSGAEAEWRFWEQFKS